MKILMDFDGVFTEPSREGARCTEIFSELLANEGLLGGQRTKEMIEKARILVHSSPFSYGWRSENRLSAFGPEDPLVEGIAIGDALDQWASTGDAELNAALSSLKIKNFLELSNLAFQKMSDELKTNGGPHVDLEAVKTVKSWIGAGHKVRVVSNSDASKLKAFFDLHGLHEGDGFGFRGGARKFELSTTPIILSLGEMNVFVDRPRYREVLITERPDVVVGDVLSLDLATPLALSNEGLLSAQIKLVLKKRVYTPAFSIRSAALDSRFVVGNSWTEINSA